MRFSGGRRAGKSLGLSGRMRFYECCPVARLLSLVQLGSIARIRAVRIVAFQVGR